MIIFLLGCLVVFGFKCTVLALMWHGCEEVNKL
jgi:hypothetical protein